MNKTEKNNLLRALKWLSIGTAAGAGSTYAFKKYHNNKIDKEVESIINQGRDDSDTLVLTIPKKKIEEYKRQKAMKSASARDFVKHFPETDGVTVTRDTGNLNTVRNRLGAFVSDSFITDNDSIHDTHHHKRQKSAGAFFDNSIGTAGSITAAVLGAAAGYKVVSKIMAKKQLDKLDDIAEAERHEYLDKLMKQSEFSGVKQAGPVYEIADIISGKPNIASDATGALLALILAGSIGTAALTRHQLKKYQDKKDVSKVLDSESQPEIKKVVIKSGSHDNNPAVVSCDACLASICGIVDTMRHIGEKTAEEAVSQKLDPEYIKSMTIKFASDNTATNNVLNSNSNLIKLASLLANLAEVSANHAIINDNSNREILNKLDEISSKKKKSKSSKKNKAKTRVELEVDSLDPNVLAYVLEHKDTIRRSLDKLKYTDKL